MTAGKPTVPPLAVLSAATAAGTATGGALGIFLLGGRWHPAAPALVIALGMVAVIGIVMVNLPEGRLHENDDLDDDGAHDGWRAREARGPVTDPQTPDPDPALPRPRPPHDGAAARRRSDRPAEEPAAEARSEAIMIALPVPSAGQWWDHGARAAGDAAQDPPPAQQIADPDLESYLASSLLAQCPNCGSFDLLVSAVEPGYEFVCHDCRHDWGWQPGQRWPRLRVSPRRRRTGSPSSL